jgi:hypothetical protein
MAKFKYSEHLHYIQINCNHKIHDMDNKFTLMEIMDKY